MGTGRATVARLWAAGLGSAAVYWLAFALPYPLTRHFTRLADIGELSEYRPAAAAGYGIACTALFALYVAGWRLALRVEWRRGLWAVVIPWMASAFACLLVYPVTAMDAYC